MTIRARLRQLWKRITTPTVTVHVRYTMNGNPMTADQIIAFHNAFKRMDETFAEMDKVFRK